MDVAEVLVVREIQQVRLFATDGDFAVSGYFDEGAKRRAFDDLKGEDALKEAGLELVRAHFYNHFLSYGGCTGVICIFSWIFMKVPVVLPESCKEKIPF